MEIVLNIYFSFCDFHNIHLGCTRYLDFLLSGIRTDIRLHLSDIWLEKLSKIERFGIADVKNVKIKGDQYELKID